MAFAHARLGHHKSAPLPLDQEPLEPCKRLVLCGRDMERRRLEHAGEGAWERGVRIAYHAAECSGRIPLGQDEIACCFYGVFVGGGPFLLPDWCLR